MRKPVVIAATLLSILTLLVTGLTVREFTGDPPERQSAPFDNTATGARFYDAINGAFATGNTTPLRALLDPSFVDHDAPDSERADTGVFVAHVAGLRTSFPGLTLASEPVDTSGEFSAWRISVLGAPDGVVLGMPVRASTAWSGLDILQMRHGRILAHWGTGPHAISGTPPLAFEFDLTTTTRLVTSLEQWDFPTGSAEGIAAGRTPKLVLVRDGTLLATNIAPTRDAPHPLTTISGRSELSPLPADDWTELGPNDALLLPPGSSVSLQASGPARLVLSTLTAATIQGTAMGSGAAPATANTAPSVAKSVIASSFPQPLAAGHYGIELGRLTLPTGAGVPLHQTVGTSTLALETGALTIAADNDALTVLIGAKGTYSLQQVADLGPGDAAVVTAGAHESLFNAGDADAAIVVVNLTKLADESTK